MLIELNDLRHSINRALNLGRYQIVVKTAGGEQVPASITLDLLERDDDEYSFSTDEDFRSALNGAIDASAAAAVRVATDDHGPSVPDQRAAIRAGFDGIVDDLRTMRDMTALGEAITEVASGAAERRSSPGKWRVYRDGEKVVYETFGQPPSADAMPPVGPLTSTDGLRAGDLVRCMDDGRYPRLLGHKGRIYVLRGFDDGGVIIDTDLLPNEPNGFDRFAFVARPGVWMPWEGGENPVPGLNVMCRYEDHPESGPHASKHIIWAKPWSYHSPELNVTAYMVVDTPPSSSET